MAFSLHPRAVTWAQLAALILSAALPLALSAQQAAVTRDILYTTDSTGSYRADLYQPSSPGPHPALVMIHGGSWRSGHKSELRRLSTDLAAHGYACFSIDYDTHPRSFPFSWQESRAAVTFLRSHAAEYSIDPQRIATLGTSAGGQLAALLALAPDGPALSSAATAPSANPAPHDTPVPGGSNPQGPAAATAPPPPAPATHIPVAAAVLFNGGYDAHTRSWLLRRYLGGTCEQVPAVCNDASPDFHVHPDAPPLFVGHGTHDHLIPYSQATTFVSLLQSAHDPVTPFAATNAGHSYWRSRHWYTENLAAAEAFLAAALADGP